MEAPAAGGAKKVAPWQTAALRGAELEAQLRRLLRPHGARAPHLDSCLQALAQLGIVAIDTQGLPPHLRQARPLPPLLFVRGEPALLWRPAVAIVGSRRASPAACDWARHYAQAQVAAGKLVISGGAMGIDAAAHRAAMAHGAPTLAYLGTACDQIYPACHRELFSRLLGQGGALVSEHPPGVRTKAYHHATRNRLIAAHAATLVVVEAAERSGTLGTARLAHSLGRPILVAPPAVGGQRAGIDRLLLRGDARVAPSLANACLPLADRHAAGG